MLVKGHLMKVGCFYEDLKLLHAPLPLLGTPSVLCWPFKLHTAIQWKVLGSFLVQYYHATTRWDSRCTTEGINPLQCIRPAITIFTILAVTRMEGTKWRYNIITVKYSCFFMFLVQQKHVINQAGTNLQVYIM